MNEGGRKEVKFLGWLLLLFFHHEGTKGTKGEKGEGRREKGEEEVATGFFHHEGTKC